MIPVIVVNLPHAIQRRERIAAQLDAIGVRHSFFAGTDGRTIEPAEVTRLDPRALIFDNFRQWLPGELGYQSSFNRVMQTIANGDEPFVCVLEDDGMLQPMFHDFVTRSTLQRLPSFDILRFESEWIGRYLPLAQLGDVQIVAPYRLGGLACAQVFTREAAAAIHAGMIPSIEPFDVMVYMNRRFPQLRILDVDRPVVKHSADSSYIDPMGQRCAPAMLSATQNLRHRAFKLNLDFRTSTSFARHWGWRAKRKCLVRKPLSA
jgi:hypothetical protein